MLVYRQYHLQVQECLKSLQQLYGILLRLLHGLGNEQDVAVQENVGHTHFVLLERLVHQHPCGCSGRLLGLQL